jgi:hypothetical protein
MIDADGWRRRNVHLKSVHTISIYSDGVDYRWRYAK